MAVNVTWRYHTSLNAFCQTARTGQQYTPSLSSTPTLPPSRLSKPRAGVSRTGRAAFTATPLHIRRRRVRRSISIAFRSSLPLPVPIAHQIRSGCASRSPRGRACPKARPGALLGVSGLRWRPWVVGWWGIVSATTAATTPGPGAPTSGTGSGRPRGCVGIQ